MKNLFIPVGVMVILVAMFIVGISSQAFILVIASCGAWTPAMIGIGYWFAYRGIRARAVFTPIGILVALGMGFIGGLSTNIIPLMIASCGMFIPALIYAGWSLARIGDADIPAPAMPKTQSTILTQDELRRVITKAETAKLNHRQKVATANGRGEFD